MYNPNATNTSSQNTNIIEALNTQMLPPTNTTPSYTNNLYYDQSRYNLQSSQFNQAAGHLNDDLMMVDLDFSLLMNNAQNSSRPRAKNSYYSVQRPSPLTTPAINSYVQEAESVYPYQNYTKLSVPNVQNNLTTTSDFNSSNVDLTSTDLDSILLDEYLDPNNMIQNYSSQVSHTQVQTVANITEPTRAQKRPSSSLKASTSSSSYVNQVQKKKLKQDFYDTSSQVYDQQTYGSNNSKYKRYDEFKCWVCGDQSSGNHYGALTCEACKLFFRRHSSSIMSMNSSSNSPTSTSSSASSSSNFTSNISHCIQRNCQITLQTRSSCPECRYRKCIAVGMGLNRTTFGRHTSIQKSKYNAKCNDLFAEIMKLFVGLKENLGNKLINLNELTRFGSPNLIIPIKIPGMSHGSTVNHQVVNRYDLEAYLYKFYSDVCDLMTPQKQTETTTQTEKTHKIPINILITFCLIFGYNIMNDLNDTTINKNLQKSNFNLASNPYQLKQILKQIKQIDQQFETFAIRIKIIYFLLIMYTSFTLCSNEQMDDFFLLSINNDEVNDIQRTFLDLLNSELDFQKNTVASTRVSLLLKLDQFI